MSKLLLLSNSTMPGTSFFTWPKPHVQQLLGTNAGEVLFFPFAAVTLSYEVYAEKVRDAFGARGYSVRSVHTIKDKESAIRDAGAIVVGGGNTFALLARMYEADLLSAVRDRVAAGTPYIGWSAGANLACPTLKTTNDMPVIAPPSFEALHLVPFQINPHYHEMTFQNQGGETRRERIEEFLVLNPDRKVIGLPEGMFIRQEGDRLAIGGAGTARLFESEKPPADLHGGTDISFLL